MMKNSGDRVGGLLAGVDILARVLLIGVGRVEKEDGESLLNQRMEELVVNLLLDP
mgnify:CR=1 FL=1